MCQLTEEKRLCAVLSKIDGVGEVLRAALRRAKPPRGRVYRGGGLSVPAQGHRIYGSACIQAVSAFTGLGSNRIIVEEVDILGG